jgi:DNA-binding MarR family transcriptional regulator
MPRPTSATQSDETLAVAGRLRVSATRLARRLRQESDAGLTPSQLSALTTIDRNEALTLGALAEKERVAPASVTKTLAKLEAEGLVTRRLDERDRRVVWVTLTSLGRTRLAAMRRRKNAWLAARLAALDEHDRRRIADALAALDALTSEAP